MTKREIFLKNLMLSNEFDTYLLEHPEVADRIPDSAIIVLLPEDDPELADFNLRIAEERQEPGQSMVLVRLGKLRPKTSRIIRLKMEVPETITIDKGHDNPIYTPKKVKSFFKRTKKSS